MHGCIVCVSVGCEREIRYEITIVVVDNKIGKNESFCGGKSMWNWHSIPNNTPQVCVCEREKKSNKCLVSEWMKRETEDLLWFGH